MTLTRRQRWIDRRTGDPACGPREYAYLTDVRAGLAPYAYAAVRGWRRKDRAA